MGPNCHRRGCSSWRSPARASMLLHCIMVLAMLAARLSSAQLLSCNSELQVVNCGQLPVTTAGQQAVYTGCCKMYAPARQAAAANAQAAAAATVSAQLMPLSQRPDLNPNGPLKVRPQYYYGTCTDGLYALMPIYSGRTVTNKRQQVPKLLRPSVIQRVRADAMMHFRRQQAVVKETAAQLQWTDPKTGFIHPVTHGGPSELALMRYRIQNSIQPQITALNSLLTGVGAIPKYYPGGWYPRTDTPLDGYTGPYSMVKFEARYGGFNTNSQDCSNNYPAGAPRDTCAHVSFVELDGQMCFRQAMAYHASGNQKYAQNALRIIQGWAKTNRIWGVDKENGPLEAGWGIASMAKTLELLRGQPNWANVQGQFMSWVNSLLMPQINNYIFNIAGTAIRNGVPNVIGNWQATMVDAKMAVAILNNDKNQYNQAVQLFNEVVKDYFKWGRRVKRVGASTRRVGECTETLRDMFHSEFALGGLLQAAEMAFQQGDDLFGSNNYALPSAMELHARIINAWDNGQDESMLPTGYKWYSAIPPPPAGSQWVFNITTQMWFARDTTFQKVAELNDGFKYLLYVKFLPTGWEVGYNHYVGRLGMKLPETASLLLRYAPEWYEFHWGVGTLSAAHTAQQLWRTGVRNTTVCE